MAFALPLAALTPLAHSAAPQPPKVSVATNGSALNLGETFKVRVTVRRGAARQKVALQQRTGRGWKSVASKRLPKKGSVKRVVFTSVPQRAGFYRYRAKLLPLGVVRGAASDIVRLRVTDPATVTPPPPYVPQPLRLSLGNAAGLALPQTGLARTSTGVTSARASSTGLQVVTTTGSTYPAITSGSANVRRFLIAPNGRVYILFNSRVNLADTSVQTYGSGCLLAEVDPATGVPTCIDSTLQYINWMQDRNPPIQFDAGGAIYYTGSASGTAILRRYKDGYTSDLINDNIMLSDFLVRPDASVLVAGQTSSSGARWTRRISPTGQVKTLVADSSLYGIRAFPDGNVYLSNYLRMDRFLTADATMDPLPWVLAGESDPAKQHQSCPEPNYCQVALNRSTQTSDGRVFAPDAHAAGRPLQVFPTLTPVEVSDIATAPLLQAVGEHLLMAGTNAAGANVLVDHHPATGQRVLLGAGDEIEIYHLSPLDSDTAWFDGLRFADNRVVVGRVELSTGAVVIGSTVEGKWEDFQVFAR